MPTWANWFAIVAQSLKFGERVRHVLPEVHTDRALKARQPERQDGVKARQSKQQTSPPSGR